jgi:hypothetical protein
VTTPFFIGQRARRTKWRLEEKDEIGQQLLHSRKMKIVENIQYSGSVKNLEAQYKLTGEFKNFF